MRTPSYLLRAVSSTVRMGTLMPTPRVSVPQMTFSSPAWASCSTSRRYFGSMPAWWTPIPCRTSRLRVLPKPGGEAEAGDELGNLVLFLAGADVDAHQVLRAVDRLDLAEVDHVDRDLLGGEQLFQGLVDRGLVVVVVQRDGPLRGTDGGGRAAGQLA